MYKNPEDARARSRRYYVANRLKILAYNRRYRKTARGKAVIAAAHKRYINTPKGDYKQHKARARLRGIEFTLTFNQWWSLWENKWNPNKDWYYHMCRKGDKGGYTMGNVRVDTIYANRAEQGGSPGR